MNTAKIDDEFVKIPHCGGKIRFEFATIEGIRTVTSITFSHSAPKPASAFGMWVLPEGIPIGIDPLFWTGPGVPKKPHPAAITVTIGSDAQSMWGRKCPKCQGYFRTTSAPFLWKMTCPYCGLRTATHHYTTPAQSKYISHFLDTLFTSLDSTTPSVVSEFEGCCGDYVRSLAMAVPATKRRNARTASLKFHDLDRFTHELGDLFDIDLLTGMPKDDISFARLRFHRRHVYEHRGGIVDQKYLDDSGDEKRLGQLLRETPANIKKLGDVVLRLTASLHNTFHEILPPEETALNVLAARN